MPLSRRAFIRIAGGGTVLAAAGLSLATCDGMPEEAVAPWRGPGADEADPRRAAGRLRSLLEAVEEGIVQTDARGAICATTDWGRNSSSAAMLTPSISLFGVRPQSSISVG